MSLWETNSDPWFALCKQDCNVKYYLQPCWVEYNALYNDSKIRCQKTRINVTPSLYNHCQCDVFSLCLLLIYCYNIFLGEILEQTFAKLIVNGWYVVACWHSVRGNCPRFQNKHFKDILVESALQIKNWIWSFLRQNIL